MSQFFKEVDRRILEGHNKGAATNELYGQDSLDTSTDNNIGGAHQDEIDFDLNLGTGLASAALYGDIKDIINP